MVAKGNSGAGAASVKRKPVAKDVQNKPAPKTVVKEPVQPEDTAPVERMDIDRFFAFCQCSLKMESKVFMKHEVQLKDPIAQEMWPAVQKMCERNLGKNEKWVPAHTVLGVHELFLVEHIHHAKVKAWNDKRRFIAMFIFRSHCKIELFNQVQLPFMKEESFWKNPKAAFERGTPMDKAVTAFRAQGNSLQTSCFLIIPERVVEDDDTNLVINLLARTQRLIDLAEELWPVVNDKSSSPEHKFNIMKQKILAVHLLGETWVKMLTVVMDIAKPNMGLLHDRCEVGCGAADPLRKVLEAEGLLPPKETKPRGPTTPTPQEGFWTHNNVREGIIMVHGKIDGKTKQLLQVTKGMSGTLDRAHAIATLLCQAANKGKKIDELNIMKKALFTDNSVKVEALGLDEKMAELRLDVPKPKQANELTPLEALVKLRDMIASRKSASSRHYTEVLSEVEDTGRKHFKHLPLIIEQMKSAQKGMSCATLQVQLCEFRQFENLVRRAKSA